MYVFMGRGLYRNGLSCQCLFGTHRYLQAANGMRWLQNAYKFTSDMGVLNDYSSAELTTHPL